PLCQSARRGTAPGVPEPDAGFRCALFDVRSPVGGEQEWDSKSVVTILPRAALRQLVRRELDVTGVALGLANPARDIADLPLSLDNPHAASVDEQRIIDRSALRWPFGDGDRFAVLRPRARCV